MEYSAKRKQEAVEEAVAALALSLKDDGEAAVEAVVETNLLS